MSTTPNAERLEEFFTQDIFAGGLGVTLDSWSGGEAVAVAVPTDEHCNFVGLVHGGFMFTAADYSLAVASNSWGRKSILVSMDIQYMAAARVGESLVFHASEVGRSRNLATYRAEVRRDDKLLATATGVTFRTGEWHFGDDAWTDDWRANH